MEPRLPDGALAVFRLESLNPAYPPKHIERLSSEHVEVKAIYKGLATPIGLVSTSTDRRA